jgi:hypothetical protein
VAADHQDLVAAGGARHLGHEIGHRPPPHLVGLPLRLVAGRRQGPGQKRLGGQEVLHAQGGGVSLADLTCQPPHVVLERPGEVTLRVRERRERAAVHLARHGEHRQRRRLGRRVADGGEAKGHDEGLGKSPRRCAPRGLHPPNRRIREGMPMP